MRSTALILSHSFRVSFYDDLKDHLFQGGVDRCYVDITFTGIIVDKLVFRISIIVNFT